MRVYPRLSRFCHVQDAGRLQIPVAMGFNPGLYATNWVTQTLPPHPRYWNSFFYLFTIFTIVSKVKWLFQYKGVLKVVLAIYHVSFAQTLYVKSTISNAISSGFTISFDS